MSWEEVRQELNERVASMTEEERAKFEQSLDDSIRALERERLKRTLGRRFWILHRDGFKCWCPRCRAGDTNQPLDAKILQVHHIDFNHDNDEDSNQITLRRLCHKRFAHRRGNKSKEYFRRLLRARMNGSRRRAMDRLRNNH